MSFFLERMQTRPKVTVWCGFAADHLIGPYILHVTMNSVRYLDMLQTCLWPDVLTWNYSNAIIFMQDGATTRYALIVAPRKFPR